MRVLPSGETSSESQVPWSVENSTLRPGLRGRGDSFFASLVSLASLASSAAKVGETSRAARSKEVRIDFMHASINRGGTLVRRKVKCQRRLPRDGAGGMRKRIARSNQRQFGHVGGLDGAGGKRGATRKAKMENGKPKIGDRTKLEDGRDELCRAFGTERFWDSQHLRTGPA